MSLIEDALRRVQDPVVTSSSPPLPKAPNTQKAQKPAAKTIKPAAADLPAHSWSPQAPAQPYPRKTRVVQEAPMLMAILVLGLTGALAIASAFWMGRRISPPAATAPSMTRAPQAATKEASSAPTDAAPSVPQPAAAPAPAQGFSLSGIVAGLGQPCAMINASIVCLGERVAGGQAILVEVGDRAVILEQPDGSSLTLKLPR